jgi:hypothetical protein
MPNKKIVIAILIMSFTGTAISQNLDSLPEAKRDSLLIAVAKEVVMKYGPGYYLDYKAPIIERKVLYLNGDVGPDYYKGSRVHYIVTFLYDETKEQLEKEFAVRVGFIADKEGKPRTVTFGNGIGILLMEDFLRSGKEIEQIPYQQIPKIFRDRTKEIEIKD